MHIKGRDIYYNEQIRCLRKIDVDSLNDGVNAMHHGQRIIEYRILFQMYDSDNSPMFDHPLDATENENELIKDVHLRSNLISFSAHVPGKVSAWSDESPSLYRLEATLMQVIKSTDKTEDGSGNDDNIIQKSFIDTFTCRIGFRSIKITNRELLINGQPVLIKGVNRHDHSPTGGKAVSLKEICQDLMLMKNYNFNAIRTAHYPNDPYLYDLADELGLYVVDEANIECHGYYDMICRDHSFAASMLDRVQRMVVRDPSLCDRLVIGERGWLCHESYHASWLDQRI